MVLSIKQKKIIVGGVSTGPFSKKTLLLVVIFLNVATLLFYTTKYITISSSCLLFLGTTTLTNSQSFSSYANKYDNDRNNGIISSVIKPACEQIIPADTRLLLLTNVQPLHGSTSIISLLMSSPKISNLCKNNLRECEGFLKANEIVCNKYNNNNNNWCMRMLAGNPIDEKFFNVSYFNILDIHSVDWDLNLPILQDKIFPREVGYTKLIDIAYQNDGIPPPRMIKFGINKLIRAYILMWTPFCVMSSIQSNNMNKLQKSATMFLEEEIWSLKRMKIQHEDLIKNNQSVLVINFADMLFNENYTITRLMKFLPCAEKIHTKFIPELHKDVYPGNLWKVKGSIHDYAKQIINNTDPYQCCGYNVQQHTCQNKTLYNNLVPIDFQIELIELEEYFQIYSNVIE